jgi:amino acid transporter
VKPDTVQAPEPGSELDEASPPATGLTAAAYAAGSVLKRVLIGRPRATRELEETLLPKFLALPIFSSDPISSVAYATEAALAVLVATSVTSAHLVLPISIAIAVLLAIVVVSYSQGVKAYESSGGSYVFAKENLGMLPALVAGAALLTDYILTVAVSVAAGISGRRRASASTACSPRRSRSIAEASSEARIGTMRPATAASGLASASRTSCPTSRSPAVSL